MKRTSLGEKLTPLDVTKMSATSGSGFGNRYKSVTNAKGVTRNDAGSPDARVPLVTPLGH
jgi:hypothetical protein